MTSSDQQFVSSSNVASNSETLTNKVTSSTTNSSSHSYSSTTTTINQNSSSPSSSLLSIKNQNNSLIVSQRHKMQSRVSPKTPPPECAGCHKPILERFLLKALDRVWHEDCLKCSCCNCRLGEIGSTLFTKADLILCKRDYLRMFGATGYCSACQKQIPAFEMVMRARGNVYHLECFKCEACGHRFCVGDRFYLQDCKILCEYDYEEQMSLIAQQQQRNYYLQNTPVGMETLADNHLSTTTSHSQAQMSPQSFLQGPPPQPPTPQQHQPLPPPPPQSLPPSARSSLTLQQTQYSMLSATKSSSMDSVDTLTPKMPKSPKMLHFNDSPSLATPQLAMAGPYP